MHWEAGYEYPWAILTDLEAEQAEVSWYGMRSWVETGYKDFKRGLWGWHHSKMQNAHRVKRLWLAMAVAQVWAVSVGCQAEAKQEQTQAGTSLPARHIARRRRKRPADQPPERRLSCVVRGRLDLMAALFTAESLPQGKLLPEAWPQTITAPRNLPRPSQGLSKNEVGSCGAPPSPSSPGWRNAGIHPRARSATRPAQPRCA